MASIAIKDLSDSVELDRQAMAAIVGGARSGARYGSLLQAASSPARRLSARFSLRASSGSGRTHMVRCATRITAGALRGLLSSGLMNGCPNTRISAATAHHARHRIVDILVARLGLLPQQR
jgi:hypothetical protein